MKMTFLRPWYLLALAAILMAASYYVQWSGQGGGTTPVAFEDPRVIAAQEYLTTSRLGHNAITKGEPVKAWIVAGNDGAYTVYAGYIYNDHPWLCVVSFDENDAVTDASFNSWAGRTTPQYLRVLSYCVTGLWFLGTFIVPQFMVKCPDCSTNPLMPVVCDKRDKEVFGESFDKEGFSLPPIVERSYTCPKCGYTKITYAIPDGYRFSSVKYPYDQANLRSSGAAGLSPKELDWFERIYKKWEKDHSKQVRFENYEQWESFYKELKSREREERRRV